jgi:predicted phosphate transport protein (TIGR00153 family)
VLTQEAVMRLNIFPKEEKFFELFDEQAQLVKQICGQFKELLENFDDGEIGSRVESIRRTEDKGDELLHDILIKLARSFVTPIDREDIHLLANHMDDILDYVQGAAVRLSMFEVKEIRHGIVDLADILDDCSDLLITALARLPKFEDITDLRRSMRKLEVRGDDVNRQSVAELFKTAESVEDVLELMKWKEIIEGAENGVDKMEDVLDVLEGVVIKHA